MLDWVAQIDFFWSHGPWEENGVFEFLGVIRDCEAIVVVAVDLAGESF